MVSIKYRALRCTGDLFCSKSLSLFLRSWAKENVNHWVLPKKNDGLPKVACFLNMQSLNLVE
jgi:hypothetical protein